MGDSIVAEFVIVLDGEAKKEISDVFKKHKLIYQKFVGKLVFNINQGGITNIDRSDNVK